jgi:hypothetical protein
MNPEVGEKKRLSAWPLAAAVRFHGNKHSVDLLESFLVF